MLDFWWIVPLFFISILANGCEDEMSPKIAMVLSPLILIGKMWLPLFVMGVIVAFFTSGTDPNYHPSLLP